MNEIDDCCIAIALAQAFKKKQQKQRKRVWMKDRFKKRNEFLNENLLSDLKLSSPNNFRSLLHIDEETYQEILTLVEAKIQKKDTQMREAITPHQRLSITLHFLATGNSFADLKVTSAVSERAIGRIVIETCTEIIRTLNDYIKIPSTEDEWKKLATDFCRHWNFPNCLGVIDGKHIAIKKPPNSGTFYYNYKKFFSLVLMALVDANYEFIMVDADINGGLSAYDILGNTKFGKALAKGDLNLPNSCRLPSSEKDMPFVFVADDAFQLTENIMTPYYQTVLTEGQNIFNYRLSCARRIANNAFDILISRFKVLQGPVGLSPEKVQTIILTCCYLHNFLRRKERQTYNFMDTVNYRSTPLQRTHCKNEPSLATVIRDQFCSYFSNEGQES